MSEQPVGQQATTPQQINDPPIEHDPIGQALIGLPAAIVTGIGEAAVEGAGLAAELGKEVISWGAAEFGVGVGEHLLEESDHASAGGTPADGGAPDDGGDHSDAAAADQSLPEDPGVCEDPGYSPAEIPIE